MTTTRIEAALGRGENGSVSIRSRFDALQNLGYCPRYSLSQKPGTPPWVSGIGERHRKNVEEAA